MRCTARPTCMPRFPSAPRGSARWPPGLADPNPYDGVDFGKIDLWTWDQYHASAEGYYLEALIMFGTITGRDPRSLGDKERAADDLGMAPATIKALQDVAAAELDARRR